MSKQSAQFFKPTSNLDTVRDRRGGIFTYIPSHTIVEINFNIVKAGNIRGNYNYPEFVKKWDDCEFPIVHENFGMGDVNHGDSNSPFYRK